MDQLVFHLLQEWIRINRLNPSFIVWKKISFEKILSGIWKDTLFLVPHLISMKIQIWKFENNFGLVPFYGYLLKNMSCDLFRVL